MPFMKEFLWNLRVADARTPWESIKDDKQTLGCAETLAEPIQRFADVLEKERIQAKEIGQ